MVRNPETVRHLGDLAADILEDVDVHAGDAAAGVFFLVGGLDVPGCCGVDEAVRFHAGFLRRGQALPGQSFVGVVPNLPHRHVRPGEKRNR